MIILTKRAEFTDDGTEDDAHLKRFINQTVWGVFCAHCQKWYVGNPIVYEFNKCPRCDA
jgi:hypothetical protein